MAEVQAQVVNDSNMSLCRASKGPPADLSSPIILPVSAATSLTGKLSAVTPTTSQTNVPSVSVAVTVVLVVSVEPAAQTREYTATLMITALAITAVIGSTALLGTRGVTGEASTAAAPAQAP